MSRTQRRRLALLIAVVVHVIVLVAVRTRDLQVRPVLRVDSGAVLLELRPLQTTTPAMLGSTPPLAAPAAPPMTATATPKPSAKTTAPTTTTTAAPPTATAMTDSTLPSPAVTATTTASAGVIVDRSPRAAHAPGSVIEAIRSSDDRGPQPSRNALENALDDAPTADVDAGKGGAVLAAAKAGRALRADIAFHDVSVGMANDWFREVRGATERSLRVAVSDLDNPREVSRMAIVGNFLRDPSAWDDEARRAIGPMLAATSLHSQDRIKRLALGNSASLAAATSSTMRKSTLEDLLRRKVAGLSVRYAFEVDVHHDAAGAVTAIDVLRGATEKALVEKVRLAVEDAVAHAARAPLTIAGGQPFRSRWVLVASWFIDPPACMLLPTDSLGVEPGEYIPVCGGSFDFDGNAATSFDVQHTVVAELVRVQALVPRAP